MYSTNLATELVDTDLVSIHGDHQRIGQFIYSANELVTVNHIVLLAKLAELRTWVTAISLILQVTTHYIHRRQAFRYY